VQYIFRAGIIVFSYYVCQAPVIAITDEDGKLIIFIGIVWRSSIWRLIVSEHCSVKLQDIIIRRDIKQR